MSKINSYRMKLQEHPFYKKGWKSRELGEARMAACPHTLDSEGIDAFGIGWDDCDREITS